MENLRRIIYEFWERELPDVKPRALKPNLIANDLVNDIVGVRRCGKTYLMFYLIKKGGDRQSAIYVNFEDRRLYPVSSGVLDDILKFIHEEELLKRFGRVTLFLDEVQNVPSWERFIRNVHDELKGKVKVFVSGSNAKLLSEDYGKLLTGRHLSITLFPLSFPEFLQFQGFDYDARTPYVERKKSVMLKLLREFLEFGGFPEVVQAKERADLLRQYYSYIVARDVTARARLRKQKEVVEAIAQYVMTNSGSLLSLRKVAAFLGSSGLPVSVPTVKRYLRALEESYLVFSLPVHSFKVRDRLQQPQKYYCVDTGLRNAVSFRFSEDIGRLCENVAALELKRRGQECYYWKDAEQHEVDFAVREGLSVRQLVQVCYDVDNPDVRKREVRALLRAGKELHCRRLLVLTWDYEAEETVRYRGLRARVRFQPLWRWLETPESPSSLDWAAR